MALTTSVFTDPLFDLERTMDQMFDRAMGRYSWPQQQLMPGTRDWTGVTTREPGLFGTVGAATHAFDIIEKPDSYELTADAPGFDTNDINVELHERVLTISGKRKEEQREEKAGGRVWRSERRWHQFRRSFTLPDNAKQEDICANLDKGVLTVCIPKVPEAEKPQPKHITVQSASA